MLASASGDPTFRLWEGILWSNSWRALRSWVCAHVGRNLSRLEWREFVPGERYRTSCGEG